ncbi:MAG: ComEA family DNA-binding protein [Thermomicrobiales bacterium]|nr:ComEA family DNA-binding protein [Thermomicrobiales bacterium]
MEEPQRLQWSMLARAAMIGVALGAVVVALVVSALRARSNASVVLTVHEAPDASIIRVYVGGEVAEPGIYTLDRGSRTADAIKSAGGASRDGDAEQLQLAAVLADGEQVIVPIARPTPRPTSNTPATTNESAMSTGLIDINSATAAQLEELPEIGPKIAERVIEFRTTNGPFTSIDQLVAIRGISERIVEILRPLVTVGP